MQTVSRHRIWVSPSLLLSAHYGESATHAFAKCVVHTAYLVAGSKHDAAGRHKFVEVGWALARGYQASIGS